jgi:hypothetical protein
MNVDQTKCDHCGKIHATPNSFFDGKRRLLTAPLIVNGEKEFLDFCNEDCLREFLLKRHNAAQD